MRFFLLASALLLAAAGPVRADDWPQFLGPNRDGVSREKGLNLDWNRQPPKMLWKQPLGGGFSSMAVVGKRVYTMANRKDRDYVVCLNADDGKEIWAFDAAPRYIDQQGQGPGPRATPTYHDGRLYCLLPMGELYCLKAEDGSMAWKADIFKSTGAKNPADVFKYWGMSASPLVEGDLVIVQPGGNKNNSVAAFRKDNGKLAWTAGNDPPGYGAPIAVTVAGKRQLIVTTGNSLLSLEPATGRVNWRKAHSTVANCNCATPLVVGETLFYSSAYRSGAFSLELSAADGKPAMREKWANRDLQNHFTTSVILDGYVYGCHGDFGRVELRCVELATGKLMWTESRPGKCSLIAAEGHLIVLSEGGTLRLVKADPEQYVLKGEMKDLLTYKSWALPALADGRLYLRDQKNIICLDLRKK